MKHCIALAVLLTCSGVNAKAQTPQATDLPGKPFFIKNSWVIGGEGNWDYLTMDPKAMQLFIAHSRVVQVVDVNSGQVVGEVKGLRDAHQIALDEQGQYGFVTDGAADLLIVFDRSSFDIVARVPTGRNPRSVFFDATSGLVFVVCPETTPETTAAPRGSPTTSASSVQSTITVIDPQSHKRLADVLAPGRLGFGQADGRGLAYVNVVDQNRVVLFRTQAVATDIQNETEAREAERAEAAKNKSDAQPGTRSGKSPSPERDFPVIDWTGHAPRPPNSIPSGLRTINIDSGCVSPHGLETDATDNRIFIACENMRLVVLNTQDGSQVATLPIGAGNDALGYDPDRGLIYASNGGGVGSLTIVRRDVADTYHVIQELPTQARARTLAVNPTSGEVYLVTNIVGLDRNHNGGVGGLQTAVVPGSFQVLVVGN